MLATARVVPILSTLVFAFLSAPLLAQDVASLQKSKDPNDRIKAVRLAAADSTPAGEAALKKALDDKDLEVVHRAVEALAERKTVSDPIVGDLVDIAREFPVRATRFAAARALKAVAPAVGAKQLASKFKPKGDDRVAIAEALGIVGDEASKKTLEKLLTGEDLELRAAAIRGLAAMDPAGMTPKLVTTLDKGGSLEIAAAAESLATIGTRAAFDALLARMGKKATDVIERRLLLAATRILVAMNDTERTAALDAVKGAFSGAAAVRAARLLGRLAESKEGKAYAAACAKILLDAGLPHADAAVRKATIAALGATKDASALDPVANTLGKDADVLVRFHAIEALAGFDEAKGRAPILEAVKNDADPTVREQAAAVCGKFFWEDASPALRAALADADWRVGLAAAISLGSIQDPEALAPLSELAKNADWKRRAAGVAGIARLGSKEAIPLLIAALSDKDATVKACAHDGLKRLTYESLSADAGKWEKWWSQNASKFTYFDRKRRYQEAKEGRYESGDFRNNPYGALSEISVFVLGAGKDAVEDYLNKLSIGHTMTQSGTLPEAGLHPNALFMSNCPGELQDGDVERVDWFVRSGGYLVCTCWALTRTLVRTFPGVIHADRSAQQPATVDGQAGDPSSPLLEHVIHEGTRLLYRLAGYQIIVIDDHERFDVLVDSVEADQLWTEGILCGWFPVGHGLVLDSTAHLAVHGMTGLNLKTDRDRAAFALERMGYTYEKVRELAAAGAFKSDKSAVEACDDQTFMRLVARIVHQKRKFGG